MKKLFGMIAIVLLFSSVVFGETTKLSETIIKHNNGNDVVFAVRTICTDGYKFVVVRSLDKRGVPATGGITAGLAITQSYENQNGKAVPAQC